MAQQLAPMTVEDYDACMVAYGRDIALWPVDDQAKAAVFMETQEGADAIMLDAALGEAAAYATETALSADAGGEFLARLLAIPDQHEQAAPIVASYSIIRPSFIQQIEALLDRLLDPSRILSPVGLVFQAAVFVVVLGLGVVTGSQQTMTDTFIDYDISADLFEVDGQEYAIDD